jgi:hypothetical protein
MTRFVKVKKARKTYVCDNFGTYAHDSTIRPGDKYARISEAPRSKGEPWAYDILCKQCWDNEAIW